MKLALMITTKRKKWKDLLNANKFLVLPGAYDALTARLIERAGFLAYVIGGYPIVGSRYAIPDIGLVALGEISTGIRDVIAASSLPALVDADTGYGDVKNVTYTVQVYEKMGAGAIFIEDQVSPKRCGHMAGKDVISKEEMVKKIKAAAAARNSKDLFLIARTDARQVHGLDEALRRCEAYIKAGADGVFVEAPETVNELEVIARAFDVPQMCNMLIGGKTPILSNKELAEMGYSMIVHGIILIMRAAQALGETLSAIKNDQMPGADSFVSFEEYKKIMNFGYWTEIENRFA